MFVIRPISLQDREAFEGFAFASAIGLTNLPKNPDRLHKKILKSELSFSKDISTPGEELYIFVLEDLNTGKVIGTSGILGSVGLPKPSYFYRLETHPLNSSLPEVPKEVPILRVVSESNGPSEICGLYLLHDYRKGGLGKLLSFSRFLFIASHPHRFKDSIVAELRGKIEPNNYSPFWEGLGKHFCPISFEELYKRLDQDRSFIPDILPIFPIYISLLPKYTQDVIGNTYESTKPALQMLLKEGFRVSNLIDIFDGGPLLEAPMHAVHSIKNSRIASVEITHETLTGNNVLISNNRLDFRACVSAIKYRSDHSIVLSKETAEALKVKNDDLIRYLPLEE